MQTVYVDLLFLINFSMDFLCLLLSSRLLSRNLPLVRATFGALLGGIYSCALIFVRLPTPTYAISGLACCAIMCLIAFGAKEADPKSFFAIYLTYILSSVLLGGIMTAIFNLFNNSQALPTDLESADIPPWLVLSLSVTSILSTYAAGRFIKRRAKRDTASLIITLNGRSLTVGAMYDSGNLLRDCISGRLVIVIDQSLSKKLLGKNFDLNTEALDSIDSSLAKSISIIPYSTASGSKTMVAIRPESILISANGKSKKADALVGFADVKCTIEGCLALIPYELY